MFPSSFNNKNNHTDSPSDPYPIPLPPGAAAWPPRAPRWAWRPLGPGCRSWASTPWRRRKNATSPATITRHGNQIEKVEVIITGICVYIYICIYTNTINVCVFLPPQWSTYSLKCGFFYFCHVRPSGSRAWNLIPPDAHMVRWWPAAGAGADGRALKLWLVRPIMIWMDKHDRWMVIIDGW